MFPGLASTPKNSCLFRAVESLSSSPARPSKPSNGLSSDTCRALANLPAVIVFRPAPSTWHGSVGSLLKNPHLNISKLATASPSLREKYFPDSLDLYFHILPAPASSKTDTRKRSIKRRVRSWESMMLGQVWSS